MTWAGRVRAICIERYLPVSADCGPRQVWGGPADVAAEVSPEQRSIECLLPKGASNRLKRTCILVYTNVYSIGLQVIVLSPE